MQAAASTSSLICAAESRNHHGQKVTPATLAGIAFHQRDVGYDALPRTGRRGPMAATFGPAPCRRPRCSSESTFCFVIAAYRAAATSRSFALWRSDARQRQLQAFTRQSRSTMDFTSKPSELAGEVHQLAHHPRSRTALMMSSTRWLTESSDTLSQLSR